MARIWNKHKFNTLPKPKVFVGLSGGVDSAVSAALLQKAGYEVTGVFIKVWQPDWIECTWREDRRDAMRVAAHLGIPFFTLNAEEEYKKGVIDYMIEEYRNGRTPNPDVMCNREVKFGAFLKWARVEGADYIATGHYARIRNSGGGHELLAGVDKNKDQSYFLWTLTQDDLAHTLFPVGHMTKPEVRKLAEKLGLPNATKKDSQGLCFIGKVDVKEFLRHYIPVSEGKVLDENGKVIGRHEGALLFTIGERHGFTVTAKSPHDRPYFVTGKDVAKNTITVSDRRDLEGAMNALPSEKNEVEMEKVSWVSGSRPNKGAELKVRSRYRQELRGVKLDSSADIVRFDKPDETITPGQSLVIYVGEVCLGGGIIK